MTKTIISPHIFEEDSLMLNKRFRILKKLGKGGIGEVYLAEDLKLKRNVAIKIISSKALLGSFSKVRFLREAQIASQLEHPNICTIYEIYEQGEADYIVMQYVDGVSLDQILKPKRLNIGKILDVGLQVCDGMIEANAKGIIHRDIKPGNIMIDRRGVIKILDFGLAKTKDRTVAKKGDMGESDLTEKGFVGGTVSYISPEQAKGLALDARADVFSFGCVLYEMLEGIDPFHDNDQVAVLYNILNREVTFSGEVPEGLRDIILKSLEKDREKRYADFSELKAALEEFRSQFEIFWKKEYEGKRADPRGLKDGGHLNGKKIQSTDREDLGDIVGRLKRSKTATDPLYSSQKRRSRFFFLPLVLIVIVVAILFISHSQKEDGPIVGYSERFFILVHNFENHTGEVDLSSMVDYLIFESLNQFESFKPINPEVITLIDRDRKRLYPEKFRIKYELKGKISLIKDIVNIEVELLPVGREGRGYSMTIPGLQDKNSLLIHQIDTLTRQLYSRLFPDNQEKFKLKRVSGIYGTSWEQFALFYQGLSFYKKLETKKAEDLFLKARDLIVSKLYLADVYIFTYTRVKAVQLINEILPQIDHLTSALRLRALAINARLNFNFQEQIHYLQELKDELPFSKEALFELGEAYFHHGSAREAMTYYEQALELSSDYSKAINHLGYCYSQVGNHHKAIELFEAYRDLDQSANSFDSLGDGYFYAGDYVSAEACKKAAISMDETGVYWAYRMLANINILKAKFVAAEVCLNRYNELVDYRDRQFGLSVARSAFIFYLNRKYEKALMLIDKSLGIFDADDINHNSTLVHWLRGLILLALDRLDEAKRELDWLKEFKQRYKLSAENYASPLKYFMHLWALVLERDGFYDKADEVFKHLVGMKTQLSHWATFFHYQFFHTEYARFFMRNKKYKTALGEIDRCLEFNKDYIPALWVKAEVLERLNDLSGSSIYRQIEDLYGEAAEENFFRRLLKEKLNGIKSRKK
jgi:serine/threonine protein kinase/Tfp pilus assembly protein PilF